MENKRNAASRSTQRRLNGTVRRAFHRASRRRYQGLLFEAIATKLSDGCEFSAHNLRGEAGHFIVLRRALEEDEGAAGAFEVGEALLHLLGRADEAGL